ncbi:hypothetical protein QTO34_000966 [Cnephaeus nilssonii]|uniref:Uncharacterized protein n=1 Tax=Cnephaeus nilssonii TaxID=3371016 RepID=A0AA40HVU9_CNENI|nr:hypothetical protein QTO34_000966 [Eptesicus nilssonii]
MAATYFALHRTPQAPRLEPVLSSSLAQRRGMKRLTSTRLTRRLGPGHGAARATVGAFAGPAFPLQPRGSEGALPRLALPPAASFPAPQGPLSPLHAKAFPTRPLLSGPGGPGLDGRRRPRQRLPGGAGVEGPVAGGLKVTEGRAQEQSRPDDNAKSPRLAAPRVRQARCVLAES